LLMYDFQNLAVWTANFNTDFIYQMIQAMNTSFC
jgi:hypothetical protein